MPKMISELSVNELTMQWHVFDLRRQRTETKLDRIYTRPTKKDLADILSNSPRIDRLQDQLQDALDRLDSVEYWLTTHSVPLEVYNQYNIKPRFHQPKTLDLKT